MIHLLACCEAVCARPVESSDNDYAFVLPILLALLAGFIALLQVKSNIIANARISWMDDLRTSLSKVYATALNAIAAYKHYLDELNAVKFGSGNKENEKTHYNNYLSAITEFNITKNRIEMLLIKSMSHGDAIVKKLNLIDEMLDKRKIETTDIHLVEDMLREIVQESKLIFEQEWKRSKRIFRI